VLCVGVRVTNRIRWANRCRVVGSNGSLNAVVEMTSTRLTNVWLLVSVTWTCDTGLYPGCLISISHCTHLVPPVGVRVGDVHSCGVCCIGSLCDSRGRTNRWRVIGSKRGVHAVIEVA